MPAGMKEKEGKGKPPDEVVGEVGEGEVEGEFVGEVGVEEAEGAEDFAEESDEDDGPVPGGIFCGDDVADAVDADDHADALPEFGVVRTRDLPQVEVGVW